MTELSRSHLDQLENQSIFIFREAYHAFKNIAMPWSMGKDSNVLIWLARKAFFRARAVSGFAHRHDLRVSGNAGVSRMGDEVSQPESDRENQYRSAASAGSATRRTIR